MRRIFALALLPLFALALTAAVSNPPPVATTSQLGVVKCDGTTISCTNGTIAALGGTGSGTVTTTGTPATGNLTKFSGATSITNGDLSGDAATSGTLAVTVSKTGGVAFAASATTDTTNATNIGSGTLAAGRLPAFGSGDVSFATAGGAGTIAAGAVTLAKMANLAANSIIGNNTGAGATPIALTAAQVKTLLAIAAGDVSGLAASATTDTTNAANISSGTLNAARLPSPASGQTNKTTTVTAPTSTSVFTMAGLAGSITPNQNGKVLITISGYIIDASNTVVNVGIIYQIAHGTGTAPTSNAAVTGTVDGVAGEWTAPTAPTAAADVHVPFSITAVVSGLVNGTAYWIDLQQKAVTTASQYEFGQVSVSATEL